MPSLGAHEAFPYGFPHPVPTLRGRPRPPLFVRGSVFESSRFAGLLLTLPFHVSFPSFGAHLLRCRVDEQPYFRHVVNVSDRLGGATSRLRSLGGVSLLQALLRPAGSSRGGPLVETFLRAGVLTQSSGAPVSYRLHRINRLVACSLRPVTPSKSTS